MFNKLLSLLIVHSHNVHVLHWKIAGPAFQPDHEFLGGLYDTMYDHIDVIGEMGLQYGENPVTLKGALEMLENSENKHVLIMADSDYSSEETFKFVITIFNEILAEMDSVLKDEGVSRAHKADIETLQSWYSLRSNYLLPRRFINT